MKIISQKQHLEFDRCRNDPVYFIQKHIRIPDIFGNGGVKAFKLHDYQEELVKNYYNHTHNIVLHARQMGVSTVNAAYILWYSIFHPNTTSMMVGYNGDAGRSMLSMVRGLHDKLPEFFKYATTTNNKGRMAFINGSQIRGEGVRANTGKGISVDCVCMDDFSHAKHQDEFWKSMAPSIHFAKQVMLTSGAGFTSDLFYTIWQESNRDTVGLFHPTLLKWDDHPNRNVNYKEHNIAKLGEKTWVREYECNFIQDV